METIYRDYADKDVKFYFVYKNLAHPAKNDYVSPLTLAERLLHVKTADEELGTSFTWICDSMDNQIKHSLGSSENSEFVINPKGKIVRARSWSNPSLLRKDLEELVGKVDRVTRVADINIAASELGHQTKASKGVVPRLQMPSRFETLKTTPHPIGDNEQYYVKLLAEADSMLMRNGTGKLYLGFFMDPLYKVHWNNLVAPVHYEITSNEKIKIKQTRGDGPKVTVDSDVDPREFMVDVSNVSQRESINLKVTYFACSDDWCRPFTQEYTIHFEGDAEDGGTRLLNMDVELLGPDMRDDET